MLVSNVGGFFDPADADRAIAEGKLDLVAMARSWISNPNYGELVQEGPLRGHRPPACAATSATAGAGTTS